MNILIVVPKFKRHPEESYEFPLGLAYISSSLKKSGFHVYCIDLNHYFNINKVLHEVVEQHHIDVLCTGGISEHFFIIRDVFNFAHNYSPDLITVLGGGIITSEPKVAYEVLSPTYGVVGEGEETIVELINAIENNKDLSKINGIVFKDNTNNIVETPKRKRIANIDQIPFPDFDGFEIEKQIRNQMPNDVWRYHVLKSTPRMLPMISSRGCPFNCSFCFHPLGKGYRQRSLDNFFEELKLLINEYEINYVNVFDELFSVNKKRVYEFCERMKQYNINWGTQMRVNNVDEEILKLFKDSGGTSISYGIESASNIVLKSMRKGIKVEQIEHALELTKKSKITIQGNLIFGDSGETADTIKETVEWFDKHREYTITMGQMVAYPGSALYQLAVKKDLIKDKKEFIKKGGVGVFNLSDLPEDQFEKLPLLCRTKNLDAQLQYAGEIVFINKIQKNKIRGDIVNIKIYCPHCKHYNEYESFNIKDFSEKFGIFLVCRECYQRYFWFINRFYSYALLNCYKFLLSLPFNIGVKLFNKSKKLFSIINLLLSIFEFSPKQNLHRLKMFIYRRTKPLKSPDLKRLD